MNLAEVKRLVIPEGEVVKITHGSTVLWPSLVCDPQLTIAPNADGLTDEIFLYFDISVKGISSSLAISLTLYAGAAEYLKMNLANSTIVDTLNGAEMALPVKRDYISENNISWVYARLQYKDLTGAEKYIESQRLYI